MKITFIGAAHEVTGSCTLLESMGLRVLIDCGMEQGADTFENYELPVNAAEIDCVLLTHAHIDHSGNLPLLYKRGFRGKIYSTPETASLCGIMLPDSAHIQESEAKWRNKRAKRSGGALYEPVYNNEDAQGALSLFYTCPYDKKIQISESIEIRFHDIGHLLGSSCIEVWVTEHGMTKKIVFSGDVGNTNQPIIKDPSPLPDDEGTDFLVLESTYGDRLHDPPPDYAASLADVIQTTLDRGGNVVIPSFAVGRTQEILYFIRRIKENNMVTGHDNFSVYVDSPLANEATAIFLQCDRRCLDDETMQLVENGINPLMFPGLKTAVTTDESIAINLDPKPKVIISSSGMCEAGRIRHHLKYNLWREESTIVFVGYQAGGTLGRSLCDGAGSVRLFGEDILVQAEIKMLPGISGHADRDGLVRWVESLGKKPKLIFVNHGEDEVCDNFARHLRTKGYETYAPYSGTEFDMFSGQFAKITHGIRIEKKSKTKRAATVFARLTDAASRLIAVVHQCEGMANKDLAKFADQINTLCDKWSR